MSSVSFSVDQPSTVSSSTVVKGRGITVRYGGLTALDKVDIDVAAGEVVALLGHSGSGKSTLMKSLTRMTPIEADVLNIGDTDVLSLRHHELRPLRAQVGNIFQNFNLVPNVSALTNVLTGGLFRSGPVNRIGLFPARQRRRALELLEWVGLQDKAKQQTRTLSGGEQQRVAIARALMQEPKLILADEPVASLDPRLAGSILSLLRRIASEHHTPVIVSLHVVDLAHRYSDRVIGLSAGRIVHQGPSASLDEGVVKSIYGTEGEFGDETTR
ncbi:MAG: phosphonate ABC transporter ATP-binding protein [Actinomycetota bacterium]